jgi:hypothetical protein
MVLLGDGGWNCDVGASALRGVSALESCEPCVSKIGGLHSIFRAVGVHCAVRSWTDHRVVEAVGPALGASTSHVRATATASEALRANLLYAREHECFLALLTHRLDAAHHAPVADAVRRRIATLAFAERRIPRAGGQLVCEVVICRPHPVSSKPVNDRTIDGE